MATKLLLNLCAFAICFSFIPNALGDTLIVNDYKGYEAYKQTIGEPFCGEDTLLDRWGSICIGANIACDIFTSGAEVGIERIPANGPTRCEDPNADTNYVITVTPQPGPSFEVLEPYDSLIWVCGDASQQAETTTFWNASTTFWAGPDRDDRDAIDRWLSLGGKTIIMDCQEFIFDWVDQPKTLGLTLDVDTQAWVQSTFGIGKVVDLLSGKTNEEVIQTRNTNWYTADLNANTTPTFLDTNLPPSDEETTTKKQSNDYTLPTNEVCVDALGISSVRKMFNLPEDLQELDAGVIALWNAERINATECDPSPEIKQYNVTFMTYALGDNPLCNDIAVPVNGECEVCNGTVTNNTCSGNTIPGGDTVALDQRLYVGFFWEWTATSSALGSYLDPFLPNTYVPPPIDNGDGDDTGVTAGAIGGAVAGALLLLCCFLCLCCCLLVLVAVCLASAFMALVGYNVYSIKNAADLDQGGDL